MVDDASRMDGSMLSTTRGAEAARGQSSFVGSDGLATPDVTRIRRDVDVRSEAPTAAGSVPADPKDMAGGSIVSGLARVEAAPSSASASYGGDPATGADLSTSLRQALEEESAAASAPVPLPSERLRVAASLAEHERSQVMEPSLSVHSPNRRRAIAQAGVTPRPSRSQVVSAASPLHDPDATGEFDTKGGSEAANRSILRPSASARANFNRSVHFGDNTIFDISPKNAPGSVRRIHDYAPVAPPTFTEPASSAAAIPPPASGGAKAKPHVPGVDLPGWWNGQPSPKVHRAAPILPSPSKLPAVSNHVRRSAEKLARQRARLQSSIQSSFVSRSKQELDQVLDTVLDPISGVELSAVERNESITDGNTTFDTTGHSSFGSPNLREMLDLSLNNSGAGGRVSSSTLNHGARGPRKASRQLFNEPPAAPPGGSYPAPLRWKPVPASPNTRWAPHREADARREAEAVENALEQRQMRQGGPNRATAAPSAGSIRDPRGAGRRTLPPSRRQRNVRRVTADHTAQETKVFHPAATSTPSRSPVR